MKTVTARVTWIAILLLCTSSVPNHAFETNCFQNVILHSGETGKYLSDLVTESATRIASKYSSFDTSAYHVTIHCHDSRKVRLIILFSSKEVNGPAFRVTVDNKCRITRVERAEHFEAPFK